MDKAGKGRQGRATATLVASALSNQLGAASGSMAFPAVGPVGVVAVRQLVAVAVLLPLVRPRVRDFTLSQWWPILLLALVFGTMNLSLYAAIEQIGLGLAVTLEFLGPLAVALATTRSKGSSSVLPLLVRALLPSHSPRLPQTTPESVLHSSRHRAGPRTFC